MDPRNKAIIILMGDGSSLKNKNRIVSIRSAPTNSTQLCVIADIGHLMQLRARVGPHVHVGFIKIFMSNYERPFANGLSLAVHEKTY